MHIFISCIIDYGLARFISIKKTYGSSTEPREGVGIIASNVPSWIFIGNAWSAHINFALTTLYHIRMLEAVLY